MIKVKVKPDPYYRREGSDVHTDRYISVSQVSLSIIQGHTWFSNQREDALWRCRNHHRARHKPWRLEKINESCKGWL